jgi:hypothetical protein
MSDEFCVVLSDFIPKHIASILTEEICLSRLRSESILYIESRWDLLMAVFRALSFLLASDRGVANVDASEHE